MTDADDGTGRSEYQLEAPCAATGGSCAWASEEYYYKNGELENWELFCLNCYRVRDFAKEEFCAEEAIRVLGVDARCES